MPRSECRARLEALFEASEAVETLALACRKSAIFATDPRWPTTSKPTHHQFFLALEEW